MPQFAADIDTVIVDIEPDVDGCILTLTQQDMRPGYEKSTVNGWGKMFTALENLFLPTKSKVPRKRRPKA